MEDLWPDFEKTAPEKSPITVIKEQAAKLGDKTNQMVFAEIVKNENTNTFLIFLEPPVKQSMRPPFQYNFYLVAQAISYRYKLFSIANDIFFYPVFFFEIDKDIYNEVFPEKQGALTINNENELLTFLKNIFRAKKTLKIINALMAQVS